MNTRTASVTSLQLRPFQTERTGPKEDAAKTLFDRNEIVTEENHFKCALVHFLQKVIYGTRGEEKVRLHQFHRDMEADMQSLFEKGIGKKISFLTTVLVLMGSHLLHAQDDLKTQTLVSTSTGGVYVLSVDEQGIIDSVTEPDRLTGIQGGSYGVALGDFNNDGFIDYLLGGRSSAYRNACIEFQKGVETAHRFELGEVIFPSNWTGCTSVMDFAVADYDNDDNLDFAVNNFCNKKIHVFLGNGDGTFECVQVFDLPFYALGIDSEDLDGDGNADFIAVSWMSGDFYYDLPLEVYFGDGAGGFQQETMLLDSPYTSNYPYVGSRGIALGDFDGDGAADVVVNCERADYSDGKLLSFYRGWGDGSFEKVPLVSGKMLEGSLSGTSCLSALGAADFNIDGYIDIAGAHNDRPETVVYLGRGDGSFTLSSQMPVAPLLTGISTPPLVNSNTPPVAVAGEPSVFFTEDVLLDVDPDTFNKNANGRWVTAYIKADLEGKAQVALDGTGSSDADGDALTYLWTVIDEAGNRFTREGPEPTVTLSPGQYTVTLVVNDGKVDSEVSSTGIEVKLVEISSLVGSEFFLNGVAASWSVSNEPYLVIKFDRKEFGETLAVGRNVRVSLTGSATSVDMTRGVDVVRGVDVIQVIDTSRHGRRR